VLDYATQTQAGIRARWYVMVTSASGDSVFATMGPYPSEADAEAAAKVGRVAHYRIGIAAAGPSRRPYRSATRSTAALRP
jgi:protocatechuate 3,4-dioxygenase beta subunit